MAKNAEPKPESGAVLVLKRKAKGIDLSKYFGKVKFDIDPVQYQRQIRDEW